MIKSVFPIMKKQGYGQIININSQSGVMCEPPFPVYNASKTGSNAFRKAIQNDLAQNNIKITDVCPGLIQTDFYKRANNELPSNIMDTGLTPNDVANTVKFVFDLPLSMLYNNGKVVEKMKDFIKLVGRENLFICANLERYVEKKKI